MSWLFPYPGGKSIIADDIVALLPPHRCYVELFAGSAAVLLAKKSRSEVEVLNDLDKDIVHLFRVLRDAGSMEPVFQRLYTLLDFTPMARSVYDEWRIAWSNGKRPQDPIEWAAQWYFIKCCSINGKGGWTHSHEDDKAGQWRLHVARLRRAVERLKLVTVEEHDFADVISAYDGPNTCFYVDPPYMGVRDVDDYYPGAPHMDISRHEELAMLLNQLRGKAIVSYYPHESLDTLYPKDRWEWHRIMVKKMAQGATDGSVKDSAEELLLLNYSAYPLFKWGGLEADAYV